MIDLTEEPEHEYFHKNQHMYYVDYTATSDSQNECEELINKKSQTEFVCSNHIDASTIRNEMSEYESKLVLYRHYSWDDKFASAYLKTDKDRQEYFLLDEIRQDVINKVFFEELWDIIGKWVIKSYERRFSNRSGDSFTDGMKFNASASTPDPSESSLANLESFLSCQDGPAEMYPNSNFTVFCPRPKNETPVQLENFVSPFELASWREASFHDGKELGFEC